MIHFNRVSPYKPSILGTTIFGNTHIYTHFLFGCFQLRPFFQGASVSSSSSANYCYLILFNLNKKNNLGAILRSAAAFGVRLVLLVGRQGFKACLFGRKCWPGVNEMNEMNREPKKCWKKSQDYKLTIVPKTIWP